MVLLQNENLNEKNKYSLPVLNKNENLAPQQAAAATYQSHIVTSAGLFY